MSGPLTKLKERVLVCAWRKIPRQSTTKKSTFSACVTDNKNQSVGSAARLCRSSSFSGYWSVFLHVKFSQSAMWPKQVSKCKQRGNTHTHTHTCTHKHMNAHTHSKAHHYNLHQYHLNHYRSRSSQTWECKYQPAQFILLMIHFHNHCNVCTCIQFVNSKSWPKD